MTSLSVAEHLHLDMPRTFDELLDIESAIAEGRERLGLRLRHEVMKLLGRARDADAAAAAASRRLDHHGKADRLHQGECRLGDSRSAAAARNRRNACRRCRFPGGDLVAHQADGLGRRSYEDEPRRLDRGGKLGIFGKKSIAWMDGVGARCPGRGENRVAMLR